ncbi:thiamine-phosphate kinase [Pseudomethylobacillus aquaticus]|uniref:Thiamine-monophosphate kinase n=1 Tax=Pseudomethylobacillus aquaticus TaxID=2676064 RepID=A0A3N0UYV6_9PROT|nr:thiamine-phosphate kinase [Pseudomethylobacillus aquaticus]ROH85428.1 thiamine-phosphate kinase [Pseudomethylobacillus aquaticus]
MTTSPEFDLITRHFRRATRHTTLGIGDDAALLDITPGMQLAVSADMLVAGTHFFPDADPRLLGWKSLAVNLSDMAAMGALPKWATLAIALPAADQAWLSAFSAGLFACANRYQVDLIGGDTTRGPLAISVQIMGEVAPGKALKRSGAKVGDDIWVSGTLGNAALALAALQQRYALSAEELESCISALHQPTPRVELGLLINMMAHSAIDISDGLLADLGHILKASGTGAEIHLGRLPISRLMHQRMTDPAVQQMVLAGGDDYELCFTAPTRNHGEIAKLAGLLGLPVSCIGQVTATPGLMVRDLDQIIMQLSQHGYDHFNQASPA